MMQCTEAQALIDLQVDGSLTATRAQELHKHLRGCDACREELAELTRLREVLAAQRTDAPPPGLLENLWPTLAIAAAAAAEKKHPAGAATPAPMVWVATPDAEPPALAPADPAASSTPAAPPVSVSPSTTARPFRRSSAMSTATATATAGRAAAGHSASAQALTAQAPCPRVTPLIHPRWRKAALAMMVAVALLVVSYVVGSTNHLMSPADSTQTIMAWNPPPAPSANRAVAPQPGATPPPIEQLLNSDHQELDRLEREKKANLEAEADDRRRFLEMHKSIGTVDEAEKKLSADTLRRDLEANAGIQGSGEKSHVQTNPPPAPPILPPASPVTPLAPVDPMVTFDKNEAKTGNKRPDADAKESVAANAQTQRGQGAAQSSLDYSKLSQGDLTPKRQADAPTPSPAAAPSPAAQAQAEAQYSAQNARPKDQAGLDVNDAPAAPREGWGVRPDELAPGHETPAKPAQNPSGPTLPTADRDPFAPPPSVTGDPLTNDPAKPQLQKPKIIKNGDLSVEAKNYAEASQKALDAAIRNEGWLAHNQVVDLEGGAKRGEMTFRCLPEKYEALYNDLKKIGKVVTEKSTAQDITAQYVDMEAHLNNLKITEARMQELIKSQNAYTRMEELVAAQQKLEKVRTDIEAMEGQMRVWKNLIAYSTIRLTIAEPTVPTPAGVLAIEVASLTGAKEAIDAALEHAGGKLVTGQSNKRPDGTLFGTFEVQVELGQFSHFLTSLKALGRVTDERIQNQPFANATPEAATAVPCTLSLTLYEKATPLPGGSVRLEVASLTDAVKKLDGVLTGLHVSVTNNQSIRGADAVGNVELELSVRAGSFAALLDALKGVGKVTQQQVTGEVGTITGGTAEMPATLRVTVYEAGKPVHSMPTGSLGLEVDNFDATSDALKGIVETYKIQVEDASSRRIGKQTVAAYTLVIPAAQIDLAVRVIEKLGDVKVRQLSGIGLSDLTHPDPDAIGKVVLSIEEKPATVKPTPTGVLGINVEKYSDTQETLKTILHDFHIKVEEANSSRINQQTVAVFKLAVPAAKVDGVVAALEKLGEVNRRELQGVGLGDLTDYDDQTVGHLTVTIQEKAPTPVVKSDFERSWDDATGGFGRSLGTILRGFGAILPWLALLVFALLLGRRWFRKTPVEKTEPAAPAPAAAASAADSAPKSQPTAPAEPLSAAAEAQDPPAQS